MAQYQMGDLISFRYPAVHKQGTRAHDKSPEVLVLHPNWQGNLHGLNFNYLTRDEINLIRMLIDPTFARQYKEKFNKRNPRLGQEVDNILNTARVADITSPGMFYNNIVRPFIKSRGWDPYRRYVPSKMSGVRVLQKRAHMVGEDKESLFDKFKNKFQFMKGPRLPTFRR